jgi:uncharacterized protein YuzE
MKKTDLLHICLDERKQEVVNKRISEDIVLDIGKDKRLIVLRFSMPQNM